MIITCIKLNTVSGRCESNCSGVRGVFLGCRRISPVGRWGPPSADGDQVGMENGSLTPSDDGADMASDVVPNCCCCIFLGRGVYCLIYRPWHYHYHSHFCCCWLFIIYSFFLCFEKDEMRRKEIKKKLACNHLITVRNWGSDRFMYGYSLKRLFIGWYWLCSTTT